MSESIETLLMQGDSIQSSERQRTDAAKGYWYARAQSISTSQKGGQNCLVGQHLRTCNELQDCYRICI